MDNLKGKNVLIIAATNRPDLLDNALMRPGRFDITIELPMPDTETRRTIFELCVKNWMIDSSVNIDALTANTEGFSGAEIESLCNIAGINALRDAIDKNESDFVIGKKHFDDAWVNFKVQNV